MKHRVLFLCTGNSARSQMAEALVNARCGDAWQAYSAGTLPTGYVHPNALRALAEIGIAQSCCIWDCRSPPVSSRGSS
jgi:arsenate reductase